MKKGSNATQSTRQTASSSVGFGTKQARGAAATTADTATNNERTGYHQSAAGTVSGASSKPNPFKQAQNNSVGVGGGGAHSATAASGQERKCDSCKYRTPINQCTTFRCRDCGTYIICEYCYEDYMEKGGYYDGNDSAFNKKIQCIYCWSRHTLTDICVKTLKSLGFMPVKGSNKIQISNLTREKIKKLSNLRVIQKTLVYVIGIAPEIASEEKLKSIDYFGQYGNLQKVVVNTKDVYNATRGGPSYSAYLTFHSARESAIAILAVDQFVLNDRMIRASFGTSKFCQFFLNNQKCNNKDCLYLHELRADLEAYTKEDMQNNKFIFLEQQKIAIKLSKALDLSTDQFMKYNMDKNEALKVASERAKTTGVPLKPVLPDPTYIYHKDFHFLDEPLIERQKKREAAIAAKAAAAKQASLNEIDSASTAATNGTSHSGAAGGSTSTTTKGVASKIIGKQLKSSADNCPQEEGSKTPQSVLPIFTNQKDVINQDRKQSQLRQPLSKAMLAGQTSSTTPGNTNSNPGAGTQTDSSSAKNSHSTTNSAYNSNSQTQQTNNSEWRTVVGNESTNSQEAAASSQPQQAKSQATTGNLPFPFESFKQPNESKGPPADPTPSDDPLNILTKPNSQTGAAIFQNLITSQLANQAAQNEKISSASAAAAERFRKKEMHQKKKKKIVVESREQVAPSTAAHVVEANITKVDTAALTSTQQSPVKAQQPQPSVVPTQSQQQSSASMPTQAEESKSTVAANTQPQHSEQQQMVPSNKKRHPSSTKIAGAHESITAGQKSIVQQAANQGKFSGSIPPNKSHVVGSSSVNLANNAAGRGGTESASTLIPTSKDIKDIASGVGGSKAKKQEFMQSQIVSLGSLKKFTDQNEEESEQSPGYGRIQSRFQFAHSVDPIKKEGGFKFGFGCATNSEVDKEEILVPWKVQELIHKSIRTLSNSISNRSPEDARASNMRDASNSLVPVEEIEAELEQKWYTFEEKTQESMMLRDGNQSPTFEETKGEVASTNPFRMLHKKEKDSHQAISSNLDVKRVKYTFKQTSPGDDRGSPVEEEKKGGAAQHQHPHQQNTVSTSPFQPSSSNKEAARGTNNNTNKGVRRAGPQAERARQSAAKR